MLFLNSFSRRRVSTGGADNILIDMTSVLYFHMPKLGVLSDLIFADFLSILTANELLVNLLR